MNRTPMLLEIGTEEIPARFLLPAVADLKNIAAAALDENRIQYDDIRTFATPRRLALLVGGVAQVQSDVVKEIFGPSKKAAFDEEGKPTKAAEGFAASLNVDMSALTVRMKGKGEYVAAVVEEKGSETKSILPELMKKMILSIRFPKSMRWGSGRLHFARPIHWITAIFGSETVHFDLEGIKSSNMTRGHRFLSPASFQIREVSSYPSLLENNFVVLDHEKRKEIIRNGISKMAAAAGGRAVMDEGLLDHVNFLVEYPTPVLCSFDPGYLELPKELLITVMKDHQKYFAVQNHDGGLMNSFVVISNTRNENAEIVKTGAERVIKARFDDARFYFHEDSKERLSERVEKLKKVTFHDRLGSVYDKTKRIEAVAGYLASEIKPEAADGVLRAAHLSKTDLITGVVREFPELQGIMGKYYATINREAPEVCSALESQYLPSNFGGRIPDSDTGALLSLADRIDNIACFFSIGLVPTGSEDPFALRRQAMGIVSILLEKGYSPSLGRIFEKALEGSPASSNADVLKTISAFMEQRIEFIFSSNGYEQDVIKAVISLSSSAALKSVTARMDALRAFKTSDSYSDFLLAIKRVNNIIPKNALSPVDTALLAQEEEKNLWNAVCSVKTEAEAMLGQERFLDGMSALAALTGPINAFFDKVMVMDKQEAIKNNRLSLLREIWSAASGFADFSKLQ